MPFIAIIALVCTAGIFAFLLQHAYRKRRIIEKLKAQLAQTSQALEDSNRRGELMFSANPCPMWIYDCDSLRFLAVNNAAVQAYGYSREEFLELTLADLCADDAVSAVKDVAGRRGEGYSTAGVWRHRRKNGSILCAEIMSFKFQEDGRRKELILALDVTERCRIEQALRESQFLLQSLVDNAPFGVAQTLINENRIKTINPALRKMLGGYSLEEVLQLKISEQIYVDPKERDRLIELVRRHGIVKGWETSFRRRDGSQVRVRLTGSLGGGKDGTPEVCTSYVEDMTEQSALEQQVRQVQKLEAVGRLAGGMAHDFNNVLLVIKLSTELMLGQITPESPFSKPLLQISNAADRAATLTRQMLAFGRQQMMQTRIINLNAVVNETMHMLRRVIGEDITLVTSLPEPLENCRLDPDQVTQVILNLAVNARDAMPEGGTFHIETDTVDLDERYSREHMLVQPGRYVMLAVSDTGTGIDKSVLPHIFDPFFTTKEVGKGTGLGLSIVYGIVKQSGGYIWVYSEPAHGTTFKLYFPATKEKVEKSPVRPEVTTRPSGQTVMIVEDEAIIRGNICECLRQVGYTVVEAGNATLALKMCGDRDGHIDLVLTDLVMPEMSGYELAHALAERYPKVRVLFMSGYTENTAVRREILLRGSRFLQKPFSVADLTKAVHDALTAVSLTT